MEHLVLPTQDGRHCLCSSHTPLNPGLTLSVPCTPSLPPVSVNFAHTYNSFTGAAIGYGDSLAK